MAQLVGELLIVLTQIALILIIARVIIDWVQVFARQWRPKGWVAVLLELVYSVTDPPMRAIGKIIPPIRLGPTMLDLSPIVLIFGIYIIQIIVRLTLLSS